MKVPFVDLYAQYSELKHEIDAAIQECIEQSSFIGGKPVNSFEDQFAEYIGTKHCIGCGNGTDSIEILLKAMDVGNGDEVIVPAMSWISTSEAVTNSGATPVFVDILPDFYTIDASKIEQKITPKTKAIIPVHLYGLPAEMDEIMSIAKKYRLKILEDCAQAHGATYKGCKVGTFGDAASFSFYPGKNLGAYGDGGCMVTNDDEIAARVRMIANHGQLKKHDHQIEGRNSRLDSIQAAILTVKLKYLDKWNLNRISVATHYHSKLNHFLIKLPSGPSYSQHVYHLYVIQVNNRDELFSFLKEHHIEVAIHYPKALPFLKAYSDKKFGYDDFPIAYEMQDRILSLPIFPQINKLEIENVSLSVEKFLSSMRQIK